jgi:alpha-galactosidase/6-phospho-beta-glucosidase family protein
VACVMVGSAAMTNVRRIYHHFEEKKKEERKKMKEEKKKQATQEQYRESFFIFLKSLLTNQRPFMPLLTSYLSF